MDEPTVLFLGESGVGKTVFLSVLKHYVDTGQATPINNLNDVLCHDHQPYAVRLRRNNGALVTIRFFDDGSPISYKSIKPTAIVLCFDTCNLTSLENVQTRWNYEVRAYLDYHDRLPVMLLGLKRDSQASRSQQNHEAVVSPSQAVSIAQAMRLDLYAECSAMTGRTLQKACEDVVSLALRSLESDGGRSEPNCVTM